jgi:hypothetical protein
VLTKNPTRSSSAGRSRLAIAEPREHGGLDRHVDPGAAKLLDWRARALVRQRGLAGHARERRLPVRQVARDDLVGQAAPQPGRIVGKLHGQRRELRRGATHARAVELRELAPDHAERPTVGHDVVHVDQQHVVGVAESQHPRAQERAGREIEAHERVVLGPARRLPLAVLARPARQVLDDELEPTGRQDLLAWHAFGRREHGAQRLVTVDQRFEGTPQRLDVERPAEAIRRG